ncbi:MAG: hypothetical protein ACYCZN_01495 [Candidatus Dormibacteria bacterium]
MSGKGSARGTVSETCWICGAEPPKGGVGFLMAIGEGDICDDCGGVISHAGVAGVKGITADQVRQLRGLPKEEEG